MTDAFTDPVDVAVDVPSTSTCAPVVSAAELVAEPFTKYLVALFVTRFVEPIVPKFEIVTAAPLSAVTIPAEIERVSFAGFAGLPV